MWKRKEHRSWGNWGGQGWGLCVFLLVLSVWQLRCDGAGGQEKAAESAKEQGAEVAREAVQESAQESTQDAGQEVGQEAMQEAVSEAQPDGGMESIPEEQRPDQRGISQRPSNATCRFPARPAKLQEMRLVNAYPSLARFAAPMLAIAAPDQSNRVFVVERAGRIQVIQNNPAVTTKKLFLNISSRVRTQSEEGLLGMAFHPRFAQNGYYYVYYSHISDGRTVIARFQVDPNDPDQTLPNSEFSILELAQPYRNHNGGMIAFGFDGYLYIALGDGGSAGDPLNAGQDRTTLLGSILRIDVDAPSAPLNYTIPSDNPFVGEGGGVRAEIWAYGLRNPWRFSFDRLTGDLWAGDVGQNLIEEIDLIVKGGNYGWRLMEGSLCYNPATNCERPGLIKPVYEHPRNEAASITGGYVYRGRAIPKLSGAYIYGDYVYGTIWAMRYDGEKVTEHRRIAQMARNTLVSFGEDQEGELFVISAAEGTLYRLEIATPDPNEEPLPIKLSETGCFSSLSPLQAATGLVPYSVQMQLWSDSLEKLRWIALPDGQKIAYQEDKRWSFPQGTVLVKHFQIPPSLHPQGKLQHIETRFMVHHADGWQGYTYVWDEAQQEAQLIDNSTTRKVALLDPIQGMTRNLDYHLPSRAECLQCHNATAGYALGLETRQINRDHDYNGIVDNQLRTLDHIGFFDPPLDPNKKDYPRFPSLEDKSVPEAQRLRAYLDVNCATCHQPGLNLNTAIDLRVEASLAQMKVCDIRPERGDLGVANARLLAPGEPDRSILYLRTIRRDTLRMPNIGALIEHTEATAMLRAWIEGIPSCPAP
jgi:uncharacterized repeat protein (TIGR03806 family)